MAKFPLLDSSALLIRLDGKRYRLEMAIMRPDMSVSYLVTLASHVNASSLIEMLKDGLYENMDYVNED